MDIKASFALLLLLCPSCECGIPMLQKECKLLDMSYTLAEGGFMTSPIKPFLDNNYRKTTLAKGVVPGAPGYDPFYVFYGTFSMNEHLGTHVDSPLHVLKDQQAADKPGMNTIDKVPLSQLVGEACVIDIPTAHRDNPDYAITVQDVLDWEQEHGKLHDGCIVIVRTGLGEHWQDRHQYLGIDGPDVRLENGWPVNQHWPSLHEDTARWILANRGMTAIGIDALGFDVGNKKDYANSVHSVVLGSNKPGFENLRNVDKLPHRGATVFALPLRLDAASGAPARVMAIGWNGPSDPCRLSEPNVDIAWCAADTCRTTRATMAAAIVIMIMRYWIL